MSRVPATKPVLVLLDALIEELDEPGRELRRRGWDAKVQIDLAEEHEDHFFDVSLRVRVFAPGPIPIEARCE